MDKILRRYVIPLGILIVGSFLINFFKNLIPNVINANVYYLLVVLMLFAFGFSLNNQRSRLKSFYWRHIIIILFLVFMYLYDTNILDVQLFNWFRKYIIADNIIIKIFYVYFGWLFVEK
ncbi:MAG: hypothetical protein GX769_00780 [Erysipelothrix sp.]|nr:hypothetical protein [Erysipelothrix sp.]